MNVATDRRPFPARFWEYQKERFPLLRHGILIAVFTFSAASYSRICRGAEGFIPIDHYIIGAITSFLLFFLLRVFDEFKDAGEDARYRPYRPVPRGLIGLRELGWTGAAAVGLILAMNGIVMPVMLLALLLVLGYMVVMAKEFFVREWLKRHPIAYLLSHMLVMPMIDLYTTGLDWINAGVPPPRGLEFFLLLTFLNGIVIEVGRKIRGGEAEEEGVETYSALYGAGRAVVSWLAILLLTYGSAVLAAFYAGFGAVGFGVLSGFFLLCAFPALRFLRSRSQPHAALIETAAGIWTIGMYLTLGAAPMVIDLLGSA